MIPSRWRSPTVASACCNVYRRRLEHVRRVLRVKTRRENVFSLSRVGKYAASYRNHATNSVRLVFVYVVFELFDYRIDFQSLNRRLLPALPPTPSTSSRIHGDTFASTFQIEETIEFPLDCERNEVTDRMYKRTRRTRGYRVRFSKCENTFTNTFNNACLRH